MTQSALIQALIDPVDREHIKGLYQNFHIARPEVKKSTKRKASTEAEDGSKAKRAPKKKKSDVTADMTQDRFELTLKMLHGKVGDLHVMLGNLLQMKGGLPVKGLETVLSSEEEM
jgi:hypothetical protein